MERATNTSAKARVTDYDIEQMVSVLLRTGVLVAGTIVLAGGLYFLSRHGADPVSYRKFNGQLAIDRHIGGIVKGAQQWRL